MVTVLNKVCFAQFALFSPPPHLSTGHQDLKWYNSFKIFMFITNKTTIFPAEDDDGYRSASPTSQTAQSAACVILWGEWMLWQFSFLCYPFQIPSQFKQNMLFFSRKHHLQRCKRLVLFHITWSLGKVSICDIFTMHTRKKEFLR